MNAKFVCRSAHPKNGLLQVHLTHDPGAPGQPSDILINAAPEILSQTFMEGDLWGVTLTLIQRAGTNGVNRV